MKYTPEPVEYFLLAMLLMIFFSMWNGLVNKQMFNDKTDEQKRATSALWHFVGVVIRIVLGLVAFMSFGYNGAFASVIVGFLVYNKLMNFVRGLPLNHYGSKGFDVITKKYYLDYVSAALSVVLIILINFVL